VSAPRHSVRIALGGTELTVSSEHPPEYTQEVARYFDAVLARIRSSVPSVDAHRAALLAGLAITDELFKGRQGDGDHASRLAGLTDRLARLLPPARRGGRAAGAPLPAD
jgi:cell division protein ZapA (FtsZ GTPase activity inhibitor)